MPTHFLMCPPDYFGVNYSINPWMKDQIGKVDPAAGRRQWNAFHKTLSERAEVYLMEPRPHVPDLVFTANAGLLYGNRFVPSRFRFRERKPEEPFFRQWFHLRGYDIADIGNDFCFEGAGDALLQPGQPKLWLGYGFRTDLKAGEFLSSTLQVRVIPLRLADPRFYHLDTCFCPLLDGKVLYYPGAFDPPSLRRIEANTRPGQRIPVNEADAMQFACNLTLVDRTLIMNSASPGLRDRLKREGYTVCVRPVSEFLKAGGANKCLTLALESRSSRAPGLKTAA
ncbi:MAG: hypothetical protein COV67_10835 [Nitrospinae bacterium CG11_big_fil_rev_8_21_14_0_20_56_8]|nr:MAG: hypothetical protein COV67_10835 [Nitrospinae bacterium CG11_big_fil_rev_8_21_14_0_20_56_8]